MSNEPAKALSEQSGGIDSYAELERIVATLPPGWKDNHQAEMLLSYEAGTNVWEMEYCALDPKRNFTISADTLEEVLAEACDKTKIESRRF